MIDHIDRIQFEIGIIEFAKLLDVDNQGKFVDIAVAKLEKHIDDYKSLPYSLLKFCADIGEDCLAYNYARCRYSGKAV